MLSKRKLLRGSASNILRLALSVLVGLVLPPILVDHLSQAEYSAWILILQLSTYVNLLDLGLQTVVAKLVAQHHATGDHASSRSILSNAFSLLTMGALLGTCAVLIMAWQVPHLFHQMPAALLPQVRLSFIVIGVSLAFALPFSPFLSAFTGRQEYGFPTVVALASRFSSAVLLSLLALHHGSLFELALAMASINILTAVAQFCGWKRYASDGVSFSFFVLDRSTASHLLRSGGVISIWALSGLFISGLDTVIVGHFDYAKTGFYAIAVTATNMMLLVANGIFAPLLPAVSAIQTMSTPVHIGNITTRVSRYCTLTLSALALPLLVGAFPLLSLWVGNEYALKSAVFLQILVIGNFVRQMGYPYSLIVMATGKQHLATLAAVSEAIVNAALSIWLASKIGAVGVAIGTVVGAFVSLGLHLTVSMRFTRSAIYLSRWRYVRQGLLRPLTCILPLLLLIPSWTSNSMLPARRIPLACWFLSTLLIAYLVGLTPSDRQAFQRKLQQFLQVVSERTTP